MWQNGWRDRVWSTLDTKWDLIIIGGGITGAGLLREATRAGLRALLVEAHDFASGTSSRSSKLVHGGLRYLKNAQLKLTLESVHERERLVKEGRGLINPLSFLLTNYAQDAIPGWVFGAGLVLYDLLGFQWGHRHYDAYDMHDLCPALSVEGLRGGFRYFDAQTDDARLVLRVLQEAVEDGGTVLNYGRVIDLLRCNSFGGGEVGKVYGVILRDEAPPMFGRTCEIQAPVIINATGAWADDLRGNLGQPGRLRKLRGSHLVFAGARLPLSRAISFLHPDDNRPVFAIPWEGVTLLGTTDVDHHTDNVHQVLETDPTINADEIKYLLRAAVYLFPSCQLSHADIQATFSGIRSVINTGKVNPSQESREYILWYEKGLLTVTGGKLTTFRVMAHSALKRVHAWLPGRPHFSRQQRVLDALPVEVPALTSLPPATRLRWLGRYGKHAEDVVAIAHPGDMQVISDTPYYWAEIRWALHAEAIVHLDDLLLRRVRLGLLLPQGGLEHLQRIQTIAQDEGFWPGEKWDHEVQDYTHLWRKCYAPPV